MKIENKPSAWGWVAGMWFILLVMAAVQLSCAHSAALVTSGARRPFKSRDAYTMKIEVICIRPDGSGTLAYGSGVLIGDQSVLTAWHVASCDGMMIANVEDGNGKKSVAIVDREWRTRDVARLRTADHFGPIPPPAIAKLVDADDLCTSVAYPERKRNCGLYVESHNTVCYNGEWCQNFTMTPYVRPGNSGGAVYDDRGALVGLVTGVRSMPALAFGTALWDLRDEVFAE